MPDPIIKTSPRVLNVTTAISLTSALAIVMGLAAIVGWYAHLPRLIQVIPHAAPMQYNTALCFIFCAAALLSLNARMPTLARWLGGGVVIFTLLTLLEYLTGMDFGIDLLLFKPFFSTATAFPGRMAPLTAVCFILLGSALAFASVQRPHPRLLAAAGLIACIVATVGMIAVLGYLTGVDSAYGWGAYSRMAINTATAMIALGAGLFGWCWKAAAGQQHHFAHWVPIVASATLIVMVMVTSITTVRSLKHSLDWRKHTYLVLIAAQSFRSSLLDIQRGAQGYVLSGDVTMREPFDRGSHAAREELDQLKELTRDNPEQQLRLKDLELNLAEALSSARQVIDIHDRAGVPAVLNKATTAEQERITNQTGTLMGAFTEEEQRLLSRRSETADSDFHSTVLLLSVGTTLAALFFITGSMLVHRETQRRHRIELQLLEANENVDMLSGLLPMCAHCKSIRDDKGYWNRIETYLEQHAEVTFSHGLCESCVRELYPGIADRVLEKMQAAKAG